MNVKEGALIEKDVQVVIGSERIVLLQQQPTPQNTTTITPAPKRIKGYHNSNLLDRLFFRYVNPLIKKGYHYELMPQDYPPTGNTFSFD